MDVTNFLNRLLNNKSQASDLVENDETEILLRGSCNRITLKYNGLNFYNFEVSNGNGNLVETIVENIGNKFFLRESAILNTDGSSLL